MFRIIIVDTVGGYKRMRFLSIGNVLPGMRLARPLYGAKGEILLRENYILTEGSLKRLIELEFNGLYIEDEISEGIFIEDVVNEQVRLETASKLETIVSKNGNFAEMKPLIYNIVDSIILNSEVVLNMSSLRTHHEYTYSHCVNVGILSASVGAKLNLDREKLVQLGIAGMLHDIGKKDIPIELLDKKDKLSVEEFETLKEHPENGFKMLLNTRGISSVSKVGVLQHHERFDGTGYPKGLKGKEITEFGRILAVADTYDAMTSDRAYRSAISPSETMEYLMGDGNRLYDFDIIECFMKCIAIYPVGTLVELSDGTKGIVVKNYSDCILRPMVRNIENKVTIDLKNDEEYYKICITRSIS